MQELSESDPMKIEELDIGTEEASHGLYRQANQRNPKKQNEK